MPYSVLLVEDEVTQRMMTSRLIETKLGMKVREAANGKEALFLLQKDKAEEIDVVLVDLTMPEMDGFETMEEIHKIRPNLPCIVLTGSENIQDAIASIKMGASDFLTKPAEPGRLHVSIENALKINSLNQEVSRLTRKSTNQSGFSDIIGFDNGLASVIKTARKAANSDIPVLVSGETGTGKEVLARAIHGESKRVGNAFVAVNCAAIPPNLVESTLFGHEKGSFTGAVDKALGKFREADGGTLFLDEVGELPLETQAKLLRALQQKEIEPVGAANSVKVNVRIISATNRDLAREAANKNFRDDLLFRLNVFPLALPPLRSRKQDIIPLTEYFLEKFSISENTSLKKLAPEAENMLLEHAWPGNVRELENTIFRAVILAEEQDSISAEELEECISLTASVMNVGEDGESRPANGAFVDLQEKTGELKPMEQLEIEILNKVIERCGGNISKAASVLGIAKSTIYRKLGNS